MRVTTIYLKGKPKEDLISREQQKEYIDLIKKIEAQAERVAQMGAALLPPQHGTHCLNLTENRMAAVTLEGLIIESLMDTKREATAIESSILALEIPIERKLMQLRYLEGLTWEDVADELGKSRQWITVLHERILGKLPRGLTRYAAERIDGDSIRA
jgi:DNA-directed RNA polymerase specialized sigma24 family protein